MICKGRSINFEPAPVRLVRAWCTMGCASAQVKGAAYTCCCAVFPRDVRVRSVQQRGHGAGMARAISDNITQAIRGQRCQRWVDAGAE